ncbi:restriction endonuclease subunit S [Vibrio parahaemolyticus]|nr:restriction endonuclease subunit S [Vibrio parahaemolyticus]
MNKVRLKDIALKIQRGVSPSYDDAGIDILNQSCIRGDSVDFSKAKKFNNPSEKSKVLNGDLLINSTGTGTLGRASILASSESHIDSHITKIRPDKNLVCPEFLHIKLMSDESYRYFNLMSEGATNQIELSKATVDNFPVSLPKLDRQREIASITKRELGNADSKINALTQKLHHLEEYKTALIHNAVTKGLDANNCRILDGTPAEEMKWKDSGIEWIGDIPDGWKLIKLKDYFNVTMGETILKEDLSDESFGIPVYSATKEDVVFGYVNNASKLLNPGDIVIAARGNSIGNPNIISALSTSTQTTIQLNKKRKVNSEFIKYWMLGSHDEIFKFDNTAIPQFTVDDSKNIVSVMPGSDETLRICNYLSKKLEVLKVSKETINKKIALLLEYKKSLINEAVSGQ